jgi:predicted N-acetyltransferase YhbS
VTSRGFRDGDLRLLLELEQELWPSSQQTFGAIAFWSAQLLHDDWTAQLWFDGDVLVCWGWLSGGDLEWDLRPGHEDLFGELVDWATPERIWSRPDRASVVEQLGFAHDPDGPWFLVNQRSLAELDEPRLPDGYRVRTVRDADFTTRAEVQRAAFQGSRFTDEVYAVVRATRPYRTDLDCVVEGPDGSIVAYALAWLDEQNTIGELEPVATHPDHQRRGLGRAVNLFALQRLRDEGATDAVVWCRGDDAYPIPRRLYESVGFREVTRMLPFRAGSGTGLTPL